LSNEQGRQFQSSTKPKQMPYSEDAERSVLGSILIHEPAWGNMLDAGGLTAEDFFLQKHRIIFEGLLTLSVNKQAHDYTTLINVLETNGTIESIGGKTYILDLVNNTQTAAHVASYANIVRQKSIMRQLSEVGTDIVTSVYENSDIDAKELLDNAQKKILQISEKQSSGRGPVRIDKILPLVTERIDALSQCEDAITGLSTGFTDFDNMTSGLQAGDLVIVAGRPSMGKTSFAMNLAEHAAITHEKPVLVFSLEMPAEQLTLRLFSSLGRIDQHKVRTGKLADEDWPRMSSAVSMLSQAKMYIDDTPALTPQVMRSRARRVARDNGGLSMILVDYLQLMTIAGSRENRTNEVSEISRSLKALAKELNVPLVALSQLNRGLEQRSDKRPVMSDLRESGSIEQDADVIAFIYRDEVYNEDSPEKGVAEIIIRKQRNGPIGDFRLTFLGQFTRFEDYSNQFVSARSGEFV
jgi:replicative DNA helicase